MAFAHKELDVDHVNGNRSLSAQVRMGDKRKYISLDFFSPHSWIWLEEKVANSVCSD